MVKHTRTLMLAIAALAALALGGATLAQAGSSPSKPAQLKHAKVHAKKATKAQTKAKTHARTAQASGSETPGTETADGAETPGAAETPDGSEPAGSEVPNNDGPGGHADEPGNPTADHQFQGEE
jgi:hypothetical protein